MKTPWFIRELKKQLFPSKGGSVNTPPKPKPKMVNPLQQEIDRQAKEWHLEFPPANYSDLHCLILIKVEGHTWQDAKVMAQCKTQTGHHHIKANRWEPIERWLEEMVEVVE